MSENLAHLMDALGRPRAQVTLGIKDGAICFRLGDTTLRLTADQADQMSADLRMYALELRNGGPVL
jgi:hypothetical protein